MDHLPVPPLAQTLGKYLRAVRPLLSSEEWRQTGDAVAQTLEGDGPALQADLEAFADTENAQGRSWLSAAWLRGYLAIRTPLPLTSNVGFQIRVPTHLDAQPGVLAPSGSARAAAVIHRLAAVHLAWLRGELPAEVTPRGESVCGVQREVLAGGVRHPAFDIDEVRPGSLTPERREIGLLLDDHFFGVPISDEHGRLLSVEALEHGIDSALEQRPVGGTPADPGFTAPSYLGSQAASAYLNRLLEDPANSRVYDRLTHALCVVNLIRTPDTINEHLRRTAFLPGQAWAYTPITYQVSLADDFVGMHLEHSRVDAATLKTGLSLAQQADWIGEGGVASQELTQAEPLAWTFPEDIAAEMSRDIAAYRRAAEELRLDKMIVTRPVPVDLPFRVSDDAVCQWVMLYAQVATHGRARSTYEAVDLRHFQAGRTECLRSVTPEALALVRALLAGRADSALLHEALGAHKEWIKACKTGQGIDRHLTGLSFMAAKTGRTLPVEHDAGWGHLKTDFLSTTSIGDQDQIAGMAFAPTSEGGIGINYTPLKEHYEFLVISRRAHHAEVQTFRGHLTRGADALGGLLAEMVETSTES